MNNPVSNFVTAEHISKQFKLEKVVIPVLKDVSFEIETGSWTALIGASGSGKTTLLDIIGTISHPDSGKVVINGIDISTLSSSKLVHFRRENIGFVFQAYHILPELNILENVMLPSMLNGEKRSSCKERAAKFLEQVGLKDRMLHRANELSGGEQQRAAIARAMMNSPKLILADEPTGNLDSKTGAGILDLFHTFRQDLKATIIMVTHDRTIAELADRAIELKDGYIAQ